MIQIIRKKKNHFCSRSVILLSLLFLITLTACYPRVTRLNSNYLPPSMTPGVQTMMVSPNQSRICARVLKIQQSPQFSDKWNLEIEILMIQPIQGGTFAEVGQKVQAFTITDSLLFQTNEIICAEAEYLGDFQSGSFQLTHIQVSR